MGGFYGSHSQENIFWNRHAAVAGTFLAKKHPKRFGSSQATLPTNPVHKIQQTQAGSDEKSAQMKSMPLPPAGFPLLYFYPLLDSAIRTIKVMSEAKVVGLILGQWFEPKF